MEENKKNILIFSVSDLGRNFRLIRHAECLTKLGNDVKICGFDLTGIPRRVLKNRKIQVVIFPPWFNIFKNSGVFFDPILALWYGILAIGILARFGKIDYLFYSLDPIIAQSLSIFILKMGLKKGGKSILDIPEWKYTQWKGFLHQAEKFFSKKADIIIVANRAIQVVLQIQHIKTYLIRDEAGTLFHFEENNKNFHESQKEFIAEMYNIPKGYYYISIPLQNATQQIIDKTFYLMESFTESKIAFLIFANGKTQQSLIQNLNKITLKNAIARFISVNTDAYALAIRSSDLGILYKASINGFDISSEVYQYFSCHVPIAAFEFGCIRELVKEGETGFIFKTDEQLWNIIISIFIKKEIDMNSMKKACGQKIQSWDDSWISTFSSIFKVTEHLHTE